MDDLLGQVGLQDFEGLDETKMKLTDAANETPIIQFVNLVIQQAIRAQADIRLSHSVKFVTELDGQPFYEMSRRPSLALPVISDQVIADLNIAEHRIPQDQSEEIKLTIEGRAVDLRVSTLPTQFESVVLRVFGQIGPSIWTSATSAFPATSKTGIRDAVRRPNGIFIVTGPTGSGKTTTL